VLVHTALALLALVAFMTFVADFGTLWLSRRQAQNSADSGALAGAIAMAYDGGYPFSTADTGPGKQNAFLATQKNFVFGEAPAVNITTDITFPVCPDGTDTCIKVDVYRNQARGNPLPAFFGTLVGLTDQGTKATAMAQILAGNASNCMKPWAIPDKWEELYPTKQAWNPTVTFDLGKDNYVAPSKATGPGTGFTLQADLGTEVVLKHGDPQGAISPGFFFPVVLDPDCKGGNCYRDWISGCAPVTFGIGDSIEVEPGNMVGPTQQGIDDLIAQDKNAKWDTSSKSVIGSCATANPPCASFSPRIVPVPVFNTASYTYAGKSGRTTVDVVNILGFFVEKMSGKDVLGYLVAEPTLFVAGKGEVPAESAFSKVILLVR
jgi:Flp pilus assembly protein TadG